MSWEALRLTSRTPSEVYAVLGPHGVEELLRDARNALWRECPQEERTFDVVRARLNDVFERNMKVWGAIRKPTPEAFFADLLPHAADGHVRQALVLTWMMMPRSGGREFGETVTIVRGIFERLLVNWEADNLTFTKGTPRGGKAKQVVAMKKPTTTRRKRASAPRGKKVSKK